MHMLFILFFFIIKCTVWSVWGPAGMLCYNHGHFQDSGGFLQTNEQYKVSKMFWNLEGVMTSVVPDQIC